MGFKVWSVLLVSALVLVAGCMAQDLASEPNAPSAPDAPVVVAPAMPIEPGVGVQPPAALRVAPQARAITRAFPYAVQPEWRPTKSNYEEGREGANVDFIVIHYTAISYERTLQAFNILASDLSAHYVVRGDGHVAQVVGEADTAWHAGSHWFNMHSVGIEIEIDDNTNPAFTAEQYYATAALACAVAARHGIPLDRAHCRRAP